MKKSKISISYRRKIIDQLLEKYKSFYQGVVLDIGGRDRGYFKKPKDKVKKWIFADINKENKPDIVLDVANMSHIETESIDVINAIELFEHVEEIEKGLSECQRVLKKKGILIISIPFLWQIHADPFDFQRWTSTKWRGELKKHNFKIENLIIMGRYYTHLAEIIRAKLIYGSKMERFFLKIIIPFLNLMIRFDNKPNVKKNLVLNNFHNGYFIIARKNKKQHL